jgi:hypothetical protein
MGSRGLNGPKRCRKLNSSVLNKMPRDCTVQPVARLPAMNSPTRSCGIPYNDQIDQEH